MADAYYCQGVTIQVDLALRRATIDGVKVTSPELSKLFRRSDRSSPKALTQTIRRYCERFVDRSETHQERARIRSEHLGVLSTGVAAWNQWREKHPAVRPLLYEAVLTREALYGKELEGANFANAVLINADLRGQNLRHANFHEANLGGAKLHRADLTGADFCRTDLYETRMPNAKLLRANLQGTQLAKTDFRGACLEHCKVYGMSAWDLKLFNSKQKDLLIRYRAGTESVDLPVDDLQVAQFLYMLLNNQNVRSVINATTSSVVLILGSFKPERKRVLDAMRDRLRARGRVPLVFDFAPSSRRDLTETIQLLANLSQFVIVDLTDARSAPQELSNIVPNLPSVPVQPILLASQRAYAMFEHWRRYPWVLPEFLYTNPKYLLHHLERKVIRPAVERRSLTSPVSLAAAAASLEAANRELAELRKQIRRKSEVRS